MAKQRVVIYLESELLSRLKKEFSGLSDGAAAASAIEAYLEYKEYSEWSQRTAVIARATMSMLAESIFPNEPDKQEQFVRSHITKADYWLRRKLREEEKENDGSSSAIQKSATT